MLPQNQKICCCSSAPAGASLSDAYAVGTAYPAALPVGSVKEQYGLTLQQDRIRMITKTTRKKN